MTSDQFSCPALDQVADYTVLYNVARETNNYKRHNAWLQNKQGKRATQAYAYKVIICIVNS